MRLLRLGLAIALLGAIPGVTRAATATEQERQISADVNAARAERASRRCVRIGDCGSWRTSERRRWHRPMSLVTRVWVP